MFMNIPEKINYIVFEERKFHMYIYPKHLRVFPYVSSYDGQRLVRVVEVFFVVWVLASKG